MIVLSRVLDSFVGSHHSVDVVPPAGFARATVTADMGNSAVTDTTNWIRIDLEADFGTGWQRVSLGAEWHGGPGQTRPATTFSWNPLYPPRSIRGVLVNGTRGFNSGAPCGLDLEFS